MQFKIDGIVVRDVKIDGRDAEELWDDSSKQLIWKRSRDPYLDVSPGEIVLDCEGHAENIYVWSNVEWAVQ